MHRTGRAINLLRATTWNTGVGSSTPVTAVPAWHRKYSAAPPPPPPGAPSVAQESYLSGSSSSYMDEMYEAWSRDPKSVHPSWDAYFKGVQYTAPPSLGLTRSNEVPLSALAPVFAAAHSVQPLASSALQPSSKVIEAHLSVQASIR
jgi:2-oxoglutarate dehydrogenase N-terminus